MERLSRLLSVWLGKPSALVLLGLLPVALWAASGPFLHYSDTWQLVINTGTTVLSYLFMFLIQNAQNETQQAQQTNSLAMQLKLDELIRSISTARNDLIDVETKTEEELHRLKAQQGARLP